MNPGVLFALAAAALWGLAYVIDQRVLDHASPVGLLVVDTMLTAVALLPIAIGNRSAVVMIARSGPTNVSLVVASLLLSALASYCILAGIKSVGASTASVIEIAYPAFVVLFSCMFLRTLPSPLVVFGGILTLAGATVVVLASRA